MDVSAAVVSAVAAVATASELAETSFVSCLKSSSSVLRFRFRSVRLLMATFKYVFALFKDVLSHWLDDELSELLSEEDPELLEELELDDLLEVELDLELERMLLKRLRLDELDELDELDDPEALDALESTLSGSAS